MRGNNKLCLLVATLALGYVCGESACRRGASWWDRERGACAPCTRCDPARRLAVSLPCELHRDTVCQPIFQIQLFPHRKHKTNSSKISEPPSDYDYEYVDYEVSEVSESEGQDMWELEASSVAIAASGCVVFFLVVLYFSLSHAKQWRVLKQTLQSGEILLSLLCFCYFLNIFFLSYDL